MDLRVKVPLVVLMLSATPVFAGGSKLQMNIIPSPPDCSAAAGPACLNSGVACADIAGNTDCVAVGVSPKSKVSLDGKLALKATFKGVVDNSNAPVTTGAEGAADNYVLQVGLQTCTVDASEIPYCTAAHDVYLKVVLKSGNGKLKLDLSGVLNTLGGSGTALRVNHVALITPRGGGNCLGTNSTVDITARLNDATCNNGIGILGVGGIALP